MASVRKLKKTIDYLVEEVLSDCYLTIYFQPEKKDEIINIMQETVEMRNNLIDKANHPAEKNNKSLVRKHYAQINRDMISKINDVFEKLSALNKQ